MFWARSLASRSFSVLVRAADLLVIVGVQGRSRSDTDLIIAATPIAHNMALVSGNTEHFAWISDISLQDWRHA